MNSSQFVGKLAPSQVSVGVSRPKVSVVVPTYNREDTIGAAVQSVLDQTFADFEILVIDDGSTDSTEAIVCGIGDPRVSYYRQQHSGLPAVARNNGLRRAQGEYIAFLDSDDLWLRDKLAIQVAYMDAHPDVALSYTNTYQFRQDPELCDRQPLLGTDDGFSGHVFEQLYGRQRIPNLTVMIRALVVDTAGMLDEDPRLKANEDYEYWLRIAHKYEIGYVDMPLAKYRQHPDGISKARVATYEAKLALIEKLDGLYPEFVSRHQQKRGRWLSQVRYYLGRALLLEGQPQAAREQLRASWQLHPTPRVLALSLASYAGPKAIRLLAGLWMRTRPGSIPASLEGATRTKGRTS
jgi:glycosyltransferase involved in cell wall biosynthesis